MKLLGQSKSLDMLAGSLRSGRFHHGWIFSGPRGVGKFTAALHVARILLDPENRRAFNDEDLSAAKPDTKVQRLIDSGTHPDLHIIRKELALYSDSRELRERKQLNIPIDLLRERIIGGKVGETYHEAPAYRTAMLGHGKVFIIDEAELLAQEGQNSMLKTLEEPPAETYFFLVTSQPDRLYSTIRSRCQHVQFGRLDAKSMREWFKQAQSKNPDLKVADDAQQWVEQFAEGSPGMAHLAIQYGFHNWQVALNPMLGDIDSGKFPSAMGEAMGALVEEFAQAWVKAHKNASKDAANKDGARYLFSLLASHLRQQLSSTVEHGGETSHVVAMIDQLRQAERELESNVNMKLLLENLAVQWAQQTAVVAAR
jgi:DNA polymerase III subunit delta'